VVLMKLLDGINHVALLTQDMDRFVGFYQRMFDAQSVLDMQEENLRIVLIDVGSGGTGPGIQLHRSGRLGGRSDVAQAGHSLASAPPPS
jgi:catechol 2,3-dioxygenase-like lactoylglutathione lyase family enzyme